MGHLPARPTQRPSPLVAPIGAPPELYAGEPLSRPGRPCDCLGVGLPVAPSLRGRSPPRSVHTRLPARSTGARAQRALHWRDWCTIARLEGPEGEGWLV